MGAHGYKGYLSRCSGSTTRTWVRRDTKRTRACVHPLAAGHIRDVGSLVVHSPLCPPPQRPSPTARASMSIAYRGTHLLQPPTHPHLGPSPAAPAARSFSAATLRTASATSATTPSTSATKRMLRADAAGTRTASPGDSSAAARPAVSSKEVARVSASSRAAASREEEKAGGGGEARVTLLPEDMQ